MAPPRWRPREGTSSPVARIMRNAFANVRAASKEAAANLRAASKEMAAASKEALREAGVRTKALSETVGAVVEVKAAAAAEKTRLLAQVAAEKASVVGDRAAKAIVEGTAKAQAALAARRGDAQSPGACIPTPPATLHVPAWQPHAAVGPLGRCELCPKLRFVVLP